MLKPTVFISYSHNDEEWKDRLLPHLKAIEQQGDIILWADTKIDTGDEWYPAIKEALQKSSVSICLISQYYLASDFINKEEIPELKKKREDEGLLLLPILIRPCPWKKIRWLNKLQIFPRNDISLEEIKPKVKQEKALSEIAEYVYDKIYKPEFIEIAPPKPVWSAPEKIDIDRLPVTGMELFGREKELTQLDEAWESPDTNVISFIAWGGVGKSTLVNKWLDYMKKDNYKNAERVFAWSFYSQGTGEKVTSADSFISEALIWFGDPDPTSGSAWDKGKRLAKLINEKKTLLILDGMEPLQSSHELEKGKIKDQGLASFLRSLSRKNNGLCIITSRENVSDIAKYPQFVKQESLEKLSVNAGTALLRVGGVKGTDDELRTAVEAFGNHALAIKLLPIYLQNIEGHRATEALNIPDLNIPDEKGRHPHRVIEVLSKRFEGKPEGDLLKILGFFDRPADIEAIRKIIETPIIENLTDNLCDKGEAVLLKAISSLRNETLLTKSSKHNPHTLDCHPLIREHFGEKLAKNNPEAWKEAHSRLYEYYKNLPKKHLPDTIEEMEPLFAAVNHGCLAGKHQEAMDDVYYNRIKRGHEHYSTQKLGAFGADLACLSSFFENLWDKPASGLREDYKAATLSWAGFRLRGVGRLTEAIQPMKEGLRINEKEKYWKGIYESAINLSELYLAIGDIIEAEKYGKLSINFADHSGNNVGMYFSRSTYADALSHAGKTEAARKLFIEAENIQKNGQPGYHYLYSLPGFQFCDLHLLLGNYQEAMKRAKSTIKYENEGWYSLLDIAHDNLTIGKALMCQLVEIGTFDFSQVEYFLHRAIYGYVLV